MKSLRKGRPMRAECFSWRLVVAASMCIASSSCSKTRVAIDDVEWDCKKNVCKVSYSIRNRGNAPLKTPVVIRAYKYGSRGRGLDTNVMGEVYDEIELERGEKRRIEREVTFFTEPSDIDVSLSTSYGVPKWIGRP